MNEFITTQHYIIVSSILFSIGVVGLLLHKKNIITLLMSIELMLLSANINFAAFSVYLNDISGQIFAIIVLAIAASETAIGLAILILCFRNKGSIEVEDASKMRG
jgi:NADH-quinone oxidoreductase subunit K